MTTAPLESTPSIFLEDGTEAWLLRSDGDKTTIATNRAFPHGSTVRASTVKGPFELKVHRCKKVKERFEIDGRLKNLSREVKAFLVGDSLAPLGAQHHAQDEPETDP